MFNFDGEKVPCPNRDPVSKLCNIYESRYKPGAPAVEIVGFHRLERSARAFPVFRALACGRILDIIARKELPPEVEAQCCFAHPELLERDNGKS